MMRRNSLPSFEDNLGEVSVSGLCFDVSGFMLFVVAEHPPVRVR